MGYRSEVALTLKNDDFNALVNKAKNECTDTLAMLQGAELFQNDKYTTTYLDWYKWYSDYPEVIFIEAYMSEVPHLFHRLGEDIEDYEYSENIGVYGDENYSMVDCVSVIRRLCVGNAGRKIMIQIYIGEDI